jgi:subtilisin family serine protease
MKVLNIMLLISFASLASARVGSPHRFLPAVNGQGIPDEYVVLFEDDTDPRGVLQGLINGGQAQEIEVLRVYDFAVKGFAVRMNLNALENAIRHLDGLVSIEENQIVSLDSEQTPVVSWGIDRVDQTFSTNDKYIYECGGSNVDVYIVDTGIHSSHADFGGRARFGKDCTGEGDNDNNGHGTHVAGKCDLLLQSCCSVSFYSDILPSLPFPGTVGGNEYGIAKSANLIAVKVLGADGSGSLANVIAGIDWVVAEAQSRTNGAVANLSLSAAAVIPSINTAVTNAVTAGVVMVVAAGNSNADACNYSPAAALNSITVGATARDDSRASFSNFGLCVDIFAPGVSIISAKTNTISESVSYSGTSMAAPHVAGVAALLLEESPGISPGDLKQKMLDSATSGVVTNPGSGSPDRMLYTGDITAAAPAPAPGPGPAPAPDPTPAPAPAPALTCKVKSVSCTNDSQCCSEKCKGAQDKSCK